MSLPLFKLTLKQNFKLFLIFIAILTLYVSVIIYMYNPDDIEGVMAMLEAMPQDMMKAFGFNSAVTGLTSFLASWLYGFIVVLFPAIYCILLGHKLVAKSVDNGSMACLLTTPDSRIKIIVTKAMYALLTVILLQVYVTVLTIVICEMKFPNEIDVTSFVKLNITTGLLNIMTLSITFFFSSLFNNGSYSSLFGAGVPLMSFIFSMVYGISKDKEFFKNISYYAWYDAVELVNGTKYTGVTLLYFVISIALFTASFIIFKRKQLPL